MLYSLTDELIIKILSQTDIHSSLRFLYASKQLMQMIPVLPEISNLRIRQAKKQFDLLSKGDPSAINVENKRLAELRNKICFNRPTPRK